MEWRTRMEELLRENERLVNQVERFRVDGDEPRVEGVLQQIEHYIAALNAFYDEIGSSIRQTELSFDLRPWLSLDFRNDLSQGREGPRSKV